MSHNVRYCRIATNPGEWDLFRRAGPCDRSAPGGRREDKGAKMKTSLSRMLSVLDAFSEEKPIRTVEDIAEAFAYTRATAYRYVAELCESGLLTRVAQGAYALGPRIIELDRQIQRSDPLLDVADPVMHGLLQSDHGQVVLLCSLFRDRVLCAHQVGQDKALALSYTRGRPMPLFRGATSKVILAWLPERRLTRLYADHADEIRKAKLGRTREEFLSSLKAIRRQGYVRTRAEVDPGVIGVGVPLFGGEHAVIGSLSMVFAEDQFIEQNADAVIAQLKQAAGAIGQGLARYGVVSPPRAAAVRPNRPRAARAAPSM